MRRRPPTPPPPPPSADEALPFREAVRDVRPLSAVARAPQPLPAPARARFRRLDERRVLLESMQADASERLLDTGDELTFRRESLNPRLLTRLRRGEFAIEAELDLHGLTEREARAALKAFVAAALAHGQRCVRVVHGKGLGSGPAGPVLKNAVNSWLRRLEAVLAFASAPRRAGGTGAVSVLLARAPR